MNEIMMVSLTYSYEMESHCECLGSEFLLSSAL